VGRAAYAERASGGPHSTLEIVVTPGRTFMFSAWHHDYRIVYTEAASSQDGRAEPKWNGYSVVRGKATRSW